MASGAIRLNKINKDFSSKTTGKKIDRRSQRPKYCDSNNKHIDTNNKSSSQNFGLKLTIFSSGS